MKLLFTSYVSTPGYSHPGEWLKRIEGFTGILEELCQDHEVTSIERINYEGEFEQNGVRYIFIKQGKKTVRFPFQMHRLIRKLRPDVVFVNGLIFPLQVLQLRSALGGKVKIILFHRSEKPFNGIKGFLQRIASRRVDSILFTSLEMGEEWLKKGNIHDRKKIHEVFHGSSVFHPADKDQARSILSVSGTPVFLFLGRLDANKDPMTVLKAFVKFLSLQPLARLYMIYHTEELLHEINDLINRDERAVQAIKLVGRVGHGELQNWLNASDFIISGSHYEGGGIAVCEAMSCGCIPILTNIMSFRAMTAGKCGFLYKPGDDKELLNALSKTKGMDIADERKKARDQFEKDLSFAAIGRKIIRLINSLQPQNSR